MNIMAVPPPKSIDEPQRLYATIILSLIFHAIVILGVGFTLSDEAPLASTLEVIFSHTSTPLTPKQADFLAQANQQGGGNHDRIAQPSTLQTETAKHSDSEAYFSTEQGIVHSVPPIPQQRIITSRHGKSPAPIENKITLSEQVRPPTASIRNYHDINTAKLTAEINLRSEKYAKRPNRKFISASTHEYAYASYMRTWIDRAERVGNLNYPDEARQRRLRGKVVITVGVRRDGSIENSRVLVSSGTPLLDAAAIRLVHLAQPFPPLPEIDDNIDILQVTRTWLFLPDGELRDNN